VVIIRIKIGILCGRISINAVALFLVHFHKLLLPPVFRNGVIHFGIVATNVQVTVAMERAVLKYMVMDIC
jgi:hypothetical protein